MKETISLLPVALSGLSTDEELAEYGLGVEHLEELMIRICIRLLENRCRLILGGTLGNPTRRETEYLVDTLRTWLPPAVGDAIQLPRKSTWPIVSYSPWPECENLTVQVHAHLAGICEMVNVLPHSASEELMEKHLNEHARNTLAADAISEMRRLTTDACSLRVIWGGKLQSAQGWLPIALEETALTIRQRKPLLVFGGFGGCCALLAKFLSERTAAWPSALDFSAQQCRQKFGQLSERRLSLIRKQFLDAKMTVLQFREHLHQALDKDSTIMAIDARTFFACLQADSARRVIRCTTEVVKQLQKNET